MRKDIQINTSTHDIVLHDKNLVATYPFEWVQEGDTYLYGQITIPEYVSTRMLEETGVRVSIPYTPIYKPITIRIVRELENGSLQTMINPVNRTEWFNIYFTDCGAIIISADKLMRKTSLSRFA